MQYQCEADKFKSNNNKNDLILLIVKYGKNKKGLPYKKNEFNGLEKKQLYCIWNKIKKSL